MKTSKEVIVYILENCYWGSYEIFQDKKERHYVQYQEKGELVYKSKWGTLEELVGTYPYGEESFEIKLHTKHIYLDD